MACKWSEAAITDELGSLAGRIVEELVNVVDDVCSNKNEPSKVATVNTSDCYRRTVQIVVR